MAKKLDLNKTVFELTQEYPELVDIMAGLGFTEITKKPMLYSMGKMMTIPKGAKMKKIPMIDVMTTLMRHGFEPVGDMPDMASVSKTQWQEDNAGHPSADRREQLKAYLKGSATEKPWKMCGRISFARSGKWKHPRLWRRSRRFWRKARP